ncbi:PDZ domain-containing protein, partial [Desulfoluna sp.]|uniref:PDZ domain-containing protein n=1 Tax=Desulfoluna sp. TaxID=2045199 RepID=UPI0026363F16
GGQGLGFAIPVKLAAGIIAQLKEDGNVTRGWLGVAIQEIEGEVAKYYGLSSPKGVMIMDAFKGDPAEKAGIKAKDIIVSIDGKKVESLKDLTGIVASQKVGDKVKVTFLRNGKEKTVKVKIAKRVDRRAAGARGMGSGDADLGIDIASISPEMAKRYNLSDTQGVLITGVKPRSKGSEIGLVHGDIIKEVNHQAVKAEDDYFEVLDGIEKGDQVDMLIIRRGRGYALVRFVK